MINIRSLKLSLLILVLLLLVGCSSGKNSETSPLENGSAQGAEEVVIGGIQSLTGPHSSWDIYSSKGIQMAVAEINEKGGFDVNGKKYTLKYKVEDAQSSPETAMAATQKLISQDRIKFFTGSAVSTVTAPMAELMIDSGVLFLGGATVMDKYVVGNDLLFRTLPQDKLEAAHFAPAVAKYFGTKHIGALFPNDDTSKGIIEKYVPEFEAAGVKVSPIEYYQAGNTDFSPVLRKFKNLQDPIDGFFVGYVDADVTAIVRQVLEVGDLPTTFFYRGGSGEPGIKYKDQINGIAWQMIRDLDHPTDPDLIAWIDRYKKRFNEEISPNTGNALFYYDSISMLVKAMQEAGTVDDLHAIAKKLNGMKYDGVIDIEFDQEGRALFPYDIGVLKDGQVSSIN